MGEQARRKAWDVRMGGGSETNSVRRSNWGVSETDSMRRSNRGKSEMKRLAGVTASVFLRLIHQCAAFLPNRCANGNVVPLSLLLVLPIPFSTPRLTAPLVAVVFRASIKLLLVNFTPILSTFLSPGWKLYM